MRSGERIGKLTHNRTTALYFTLQRHRSPARTHPSLSETPSQEPKTEKSVVVKQAKTTIKKAKRTVGL